MVQANKLSRATVIRRYLYPVDNQADLQRVKSDLPAFKEFIDSMSQDELTEAAEVALEALNSRRELWQPALLPDWR